MQILLFFKYSVSPYAKASVFNHKIIAQLKFNQNLDSPVVKLQQNKQTAI